MEQYVNDAVELLKRLIATPSVSRDEGRAADVMAEHLRMWGLPFGREDNNLWLGCPDWDNNRPTLMLNAHIDTVKPVATWTRDPYTPSIEDGDTLYGLGANDCGGGLGVDYDGTRSSNSESSVNYSIQEYVNDCLYSFVEASNKNNIPHPNIISEGGRSLSAHHSVLILDVLESVSAPRMPEDFEPGDDDHKLVHELTDIWDKLSPRSMLEDWHDAQDIREEALELFSHGIIDLKTRAQIESLYWAISHEIAELAHHQKHVPDELRSLDKQMSDKYFCNFSLFQSMPDSWGIDQLFPIMPIERLDEQPTRSAQLQDITCDSDGKITAYVNGVQQTSYLPLHEVKAEEHYYIGVFLVGAYQEILGNMHNLFGDTNAVHLSVSEDGKGYNIDQVIDGETVADVLEYVQYEPKKLVRRLEIWVSKAIKDGKITEAEGKEFISNYRSGLYGYTYLE